LQNCGESLAQLSRHAPDVAAQLPEYRQVIAFRNLLVHGYDELKTEQVLSIIKNNLPDLIAQTSALLTKMGRL
jgi:uncharacterized protein with HEPN domain